MLGGEAQAAGTGAGGVMVKGSGRRCCFIIHGKEVGRLAGSGIEAAGGIGVVGGRRRGEGNRGGRRGGEAGQDRRRRRVRSKAGVVRRPVE